MTFLAPFAMPRRQMEKRLQLGAHILSNGIDACVITLDTSHNGLRNGDHIPVANGKAFALSSIQHSVHHDGGQIVAFPEDGAADTSGNSTNFSFHDRTSLFCLKVRQTNSV